MKFIITVNTWEEEVRNAISHVIDNDITLFEFKIYAGAIATAIAKNNLEKATDILWTYSRRGYNQEHLQEIVNQLRDNYEKEE